MCQALPSQNILDVRTDLHSSGLKISFDKGGNLKCGDNYNLFTWRIFLPYPGPKEKNKTGKQEVTLC